METGSRNYQLIKIHVVWLEEGVQAHFPKQRLVHKSIATDTLYLSKQGFFLAIYFNMKDHR